MPRSRAARLRASRTPDDAELNVMQLAPAEPSPYVYVPSAPETSAYTFDKIMASVRTMDAPCRRWRCRRKGCRNYEVSVRESCFFTKSKLPLAKGLRLLLFRYSGLPVERDHGHIVEVDETSLKKKSKYGRGHQHPDNWLFGDVDRTINLCTIISDDFASYVSVNGKHTRLLRGMDYTHRWVNHDECLVDPVTGAHTNRIKGAWVVRIKPHLKRMRGVRKELLAGYLDESLCETWFFAGKVHVCTYLEGLAMVIRKHYQA
ncbi:hypothetical protein PF001_g8663 [Phytophthora fragariae]|uniref:ISXO2-like transposase domain-containing protein n=1 Tax=Phytophthora fragariae TaxID=53985 RepID=A0A6A4DZ98_9STRA|nr:hypothetical protein PF001_g8663 [Phytophthora fragariae]